MEAHTFDCDSALEHLGGYEIVANTYKQTMNLPQTDFPMRANLAQNEPARLQWWDDIDIYHKVLEKNADGEPFVLHDGPPYANGPIHIGHAFNKILKDFVNKSHAQRGFFTPYIPGWDCHGQPIEHEVEKKIGTEKMNSLPQDVIRRMCREWADRFVNVQREGFKRLGVNADWDHPYLTFQPDYESANVEVFKRMYLDGAVYRGRKPIHWCSHCHTALAEAEIEYADEVSPSIYVNFKLNNVPAIFARAGVDVERAFVLIWTTTPWTLPANTAVSLGPDIDYCFVEADGIFMLLAHEMVESIAEVAGWNNWRVVSAQGEPVLLKGNKFEGITYQTPILHQVEGRIIWGDHVTLEAGTGAVHTAPGHGVDDYLVGQQFGVEMIMPVDDDGHLMDYVPHFGGLSTDEANPKIIEWLREKGMLVASVEITHSYPHCWRCHNPVIFRATDQWFVSMDDTGLRAKALDAIRTKVNWVPTWGANRIGSMVEDRPDWCISRQRNWGVPIPVFKCASCGETVATEATFDAVINLFATEGADAWFTKDPAEYLPEGTCCPQCGSTELKPEHDILDVWWESGVSNIGVLKHRAAADGLWWPADVYLEGSDQHRGWFQSSLLCGIGAFGQAPYKNVICCGFTVDENGEKMSKSKGNGIDPAQVANKYGADVLRLWVASTDYSVDVSVGESILARTSDAYRRFRNTFRFLLGSLADFDPETDAVASFDSLLPADQWALVRLARLLDDVNAGYDLYQYHRVFRALYDYVVGDLSAVYLDALKDRLYAEAPTSPARRSAQTVLMAILDTMVRIMSPILSFTCEEVWQHYPSALREQADRPISVQLAGWPSAETFTPALPADAARIDDDFTVILAARETVTKALEDARTQGSIGKSQQAEVVLSVPNSALEVLQRYDEELFCELFIVAGVTLEATDSDEMSASIVPTDKEKCPRCWNYRELGVNASHPDVCARCAAVLDDMTSN